MADQKLPPVVPSVGGAFCLASGSLSSRPPAAVKRSDRARRTLDTTSTTWMPAYHHSSRSEAALTSMNCFSSWMAEIAPIEPSSLILSEVKSIEAIHDGHSRARV